MELDLKLELKLNNASFIVSIGTLTQLNSPKLTG